MMSMFTEALSLDRHYPEFAKRLVILRAPGAINLIWNIFKKFMDKNVADKVTFIGKRNYKKEIIS